MRNHYEFSKMKARRNPYAKMLKQSVTIRLDRETIAYFKLLAAKTGLPYQSLINFYLRECAAQRRELSFRETGSVAARPRKAAVGTTGARI